MVKNYLWVIAVAVGLLCSCGDDGKSDASTDKTTPASTEKDTALSGDNIRVCSYNMLFEKTTPADVSKRWTYRVRIIMGIMDDYNLDIIGSQEALTWQVDKILEKGKYDKVGWDIVGTHNANYENDALFYLKSRFEVVEEGQFWYSETPQSWSWSWDATYARACTWARFREKNTLKEFYVFNTHIHHPNDNPIAHDQEVHLLVRMSSEINSEGLPMFYTGDFNSTPDRSGITYITGDGEMSDSRVVATEVLGREQTYHNFSSDPNYGWRLDYIFVNNKVTVSKYRCEDSELRTLQWGSDHHPIMIDAHLN